MHKSQTGSIVLLIVAIGLGCASDTVEMTDTTSPTVSITSPLNASIVIDSVLIIADPSDDVGVEKVEFYVDGNLSNTRGMEPWEYNWKLDGIQENSLHELSAKAYDAANNVGSSTTVTVLVKSDTTRPTVIITTPGNGSIVSDSILITLNVSDNNGVETVEFLVDGSVSSTLLSSPWQYWWVVSGLAENSAHSIVAKAYDGASNVGTSAPVNVTVVNNRALQLNGSTDYVRLPSSPSLTSFGSQITIEVWIKVYAYGAGGNIIASGYENEYAFAVFPDGKLGVTMALVNNLPDGVFFSKSALYLNVWYHIAFTYDGLTESILINGVVDTSFSTSGNVSGQYREDISIGAYTAPTFDGFFNGLVDEVRVWNISKTQAQIQALMNTELSGNEPGLMGYWSMNGNVLDKSPNANNGTIFGSPSFIPITR